MSNITPGTVAILSSLPIASVAWLMQTPMSWRRQTSVRTTTTSNGHQLHNIIGQAPVPVVVLQVHDDQQRVGVFFGPEEEFDCPDEEECEIDWDKMPGFEEQSEENADQSSNVEQMVHNKNSTTAATATAAMEYTNIGDEDRADDDLQPKHYEHSVQNSIERSRLLFEMSWQVEECEVNEDSCSNFCMDCSGSGRQFCKFCRGTRTVAFGSEFRTCIVCDTDGRVECPTCHGTGSVASWAATHDQNST